MPNYSKNTFVISVLTIYGAIESLGTLCQVRGFVVFPKQVAQFSGNIVRSGFSSSVQFNTKLGSASSVTNNEIFSVSKAPTSTCNSFTSDCTEVWIEDTDAYGIMFNGNYLRSYERALLEVYPSSEDWHITKVTRHKFKNSPVLGDKFVIRGKKVEGYDEAWDLEMVKENSKDEDEVIFNTATITLQNLSFGLDDVNSTLYSSNEHSDMDKLFVISFKSHRDEFDSLRNGEVGRNEENVCNASILGGRDLFPLRSVLNLFERARSSRLGGPSILQKIQSDGILWVVTSIDDLKLDLAGVFSEGTRPGQHMIISSDTAVKRRGMMCLL